MDRGLSESSTRTNDVVLSVDRKINTIYYKIVAHFFDSQRVSGNQTGAPGPPKCIDRGFIL